MGNNDNSPIAKQVAGYITGPMWHEYMDYLLSTLPNQKFNKPEDKDLSNLKPILRGEWGTGGSTIVNSDGTTSVVGGAAHTILYYVNKDNPLGPAPRDPYNDPQFSYWEYAIQAWAGGTGYSVGSPSTPTGGANPNSISLTITSPQNNATYITGSRVDASIQISSANPINKADYFLQGAYLGSSLYGPYGFSFVLDDSNSSPGSNTLRVIVTDSTGAQKDANVIFVKK
jgi:hypothetical protein